MKKIILFILFLSSSIFAANNFDQTIQTCFTPQENCISLLVNQINEANNSIYIQAYSFTSYELAKALVNAKNRGVSVNIIFDKSEFDPHFKSANKVIKFFKDKHIAMWRDNIPGIAHNKVMIFDGNKVETGSFNFTYSAQKFNAENLIIINDAKLAQIYFKNWIAREMQAEKI